MNLAVYLVGMLAFTSGFYFVKKSETVWNGVCSLFLSCMVWMMVQSLACEINVLLHYRVYAWQYGILGLLIGVFWWAKIIKEKKRQSYRYEWLDFFVAGFLLVFVLCWGRYQFGSHLQNFNYRSVTDSARHLYFARTLAEEGTTLTSMFFAAVNTAVWMSALEGIVSRFYQYKIYIVFDLAVLFLNGMVFWTAIRRFLKDRFLKAVGVLFTFLFVFGHPLNSLAYGTIYLSTGIMMTLLIYHVSTLLLKKEIERDWGKALLAFAMISLRYSYVLFVPAFIFGPLVYFYYDRKRERGEVTPKLVRRSWILWGSLFVLGVVYLYLFYVTGDAVLFSDLLPEGLMYGHPYADFLFLIPFLLLLLWEDWKKRRIGLEELLFLLELGLVIVMFVGTFYGRISKYYLYKSYVSLWGAAFLSVIKYISSIKKEKRDFVSSLIVTWVVMIALCVTNVENRLFERSRRYGKLSAAAACFPMYMANLSMPGELDDKAGINELIMKVAKVSCDQGILIPYVSLCMWDEIPEDPLLAEDFQRKYYSLSGQNPEWRLDVEDWGDLVEDIKKEYQYILLICESNKEQDRMEALEQLKPAETITQNVSGCYLKLHE